MMTRLENWLADANQLSTENAAGKTPVLSSAVADQSGDVAPSRLQRSIWCALAGLTLSTAGCANMNHAQSGALMGTAIGTLAGAAIGSEAGSAGAGALIGGVTGAMAGGVIGDSADAREERDIAIAERNGIIANASYQAQKQPPLNNFDLIRLAQSGVSDDVIINMIQTRGGQFDLGPDAVISLKTNGVSDRVIVMAQQSPTSAVPTVVPAPGVVPGVVVVKQPPTVLVEPAPVFVGGWWGPGHCHPRYYHHHHRGPRVGMSFGF